MEWGLMAGSVGPRLRLIRNYLQSRSIDVSEPFGLPTGSLTVLCLIAGNPASSQAELSGWAGITGPGLVGIIDELERRGLVTRERSTSDRRRNELVLSDKGRQTMDRLFAEVDPIEAPIRERLGPERMALFVELIDEALAGIAEANAKS